MTTALPAVLINIFYAFSFNGRGSSIFMTSGLHVSSWQVENHIDQKHYQKKKYIISKNNE